MVTIEKLEIIAKKHNVDINNKKWTDNKVAIFNNGNIDVVMHDCDGDLNKVYRFIPFTLEAFNTALKHANFSQWINEQTL